MKKFIQYSIALFFVVGLLVSCEKDVTVDKMTSGKADFSKYVALGDSFMAGISDGTLYLDAQENSLPSILAGQFAKVGGSDTFNQPLVKDNVGGLLFSGSQIAPNRLALQIVDGSPTPVSVQGNSTTEVTESIAKQGPFQNLGVPGAKSFHLLGSGYGDIQGMLAQPQTANPYYVRFSKPNTSILAEAVSQSPTFYTFWIGANDVLEYARTGGEIKSITSDELFKNAVSASISELAKTGAKGIIANVPDILNIPYFQLIPQKSIPLDAETATAVNSAYAQYNGGLQLAVAASAITAEEAAKRTIEFVAGVNYPVIIDSDLSDLNLSGRDIPKIRQLKAGELVTIQAASILGQRAIPDNPNSVYGVGFPLSPSFVLTENEVLNVKNAIQSYNTTLKSVAATLEIPMLDVDAVYSKLNESGILWNGASYSTEFVQGGLVSLDGIHPSQRGYALIANEFIQAINDYYFANVPLVDINQYEGVKLP